MTEVSKEEDEIFECPKCKHPFFKLSFNPFKELGHRHSVICAKCEHEVYDD